MKIDYFRNVKSGMSRSYFLRKYTLFSLKNVSNLINSMISSRLVPVWVNLVEFEMINGQSKLWHFGTYTKVDKHTYMSKISTKTILTEHRIWSCGQNGEDFSLISPTVLSQFWLKNRPLRDTMGPAMPLWYSAGQWK